MWQPGWSDGHFMDCNSEDANLNHVKRCDVTITLNSNSGVAVILVSVNAQVGVHYTQCDCKVSLNI
jgi:hypothetical protein